MGTAGRLVETIKAFDKSNKEKIERLRAAVKDIQENRQKQTGQQPHQS